MHKYAVLTHTYTHKDNNMGGGYLKILNKEHDTLK